MKTIFILGSDSGHQKTMEQHLKTLGYVVESFGSTTEFEKSTSKPFLVVLDETIVSKSSSMVQAIRALVRKKSNVPVVLTMEKYHPEVAAEVTRVGVYEVIEKNSAVFVNLRTVLDRLSVNPPKGSWFSRLFSKKTGQTLPALTV